MENHRYRITVEHLAAPHGSAREPEPLCFEVTNHDNIFAIVEKLRQANKFPHHTAQAFGVGLKLFSEVLLKNESNPLFESFLPHFGNFMKELKKKPAQS